MMEDGIAYLIKCEKTAKERLDAAMVLKMELLKRAQDDVEKEIAELRKCYEQEIASLKEEGKKKLNNIKKQLEERNRLWISILDKTNFDGLVEQVLGEILGNVRE